MIVYDRAYCKRFKKLSNTNQPATLVLVFTIQNLSTRELMKGLFQGSYISFYLNGKIHHPFLPLGLALALRALNLQAIGSNLHALLTFQRKSYLSKLEEPELKK